MNEKPTSWWSVDAAHKGHKGMKEQVLAEILLCPKIPEHWKSALVAEITAMQCSALEVHAHCTVEKGTSTLSFSLRPLF